MKQLIFLMVFFAFSVRAMDNQTLQILNTVKNKNYETALPLLEQGVRRIKDKKKKGYYSLLLSQMPVNIKMKRPRYEYALLAAQYAQNIPREKRLGLWISAGDGFFKSALLKKASYCYNKALSIVKPGELEKSYVLHKQAWIYINQKKWNRAYKLLSQAMKENTEKLKNIILSDMGKIWVESQYFKNKVSLSVLSADIQTLSPNEKKHTYKGMAQGLRRMEKQSLAPFISTLSKNKELSSDILNELLSNLTGSLSFSCQWIPWIESAKKASLNKQSVFSVLNSCGHYWGSKKNHPNRLKQIQRIASLYSQFERKGIERWPLAFLYHSLKKHNKACEESLQYLTEIKISNKFSNSLKESWRFCEKSKKINKTLVLTVTKTFLSSPTVSLKYQNKEGDYESALLEFFNLKIFSQFLKQVLIKAHKNWKGKDFLPILLLLNIKDYQTGHLKNFMDRFSVKPLSPEYLNILIARADILTEDNLNKWLPLSLISSYPQFKPYIKAFLEGHLSDKNKKNLIEKLLKHFPVKEEDKKEVALFLALHYLKSDRLLEIFKHYSKLSVVFSLESLAVEFFEKSLLDKGQACQGLRTTLQLSADKAVNLPTANLAQKLQKRYPSKNPAKPDPLMTFIYQCCEIIHPAPVLRAKNLKEIKPTLLSGVEKSWPKPLSKIRNIPPVLRSSALARDLLFLKSVQNKTYQVERNISHLEKRTSKMIMNLRSLISRYQKRRWRLKSVAEKAHFLLAKQMDLFEKELSRLARSSPHREKYIELKKIIHQWR